MADHSGYFDFEVNIARVGTRESDAYSVRVASMGGGAEHRFELPFTPDQRTIIRQAITNSALRASANLRSAGTPELGQLKDMGEALFNRLFSAELKDYYYKCWGQAVQQGRGLRLRLSIDPSLSDLPWEFLCAAKEFIGLNPQTPIVRFIEQPTPIPPLRTELPLRLLVVIASPGDRAQLDSEAEKQRISAALAALQTQGMVAVDYLEGPNTWPRLIDALRPDVNHILHFIGHGAFDSGRGEGVLLMEDAHGDAKSVGSEQIKVLMLGKRNLRLAVLNSCLGAAAEPGRPFASVAAALVRAGLPAVVAMQFEISDRAARVFSETLYETLAMNFPIDAALTEARREIALTERDSIEWATPVLFMQVADGQLFHLARATHGAGSTFDTLFTNKLLKRAEEAFDHQQWARALECYRVLALHQPNDEKIAARIALIDKLQKQKSSDVNFREQLLKRADNAFEQQHWEQAYNLYTLALDNDPDNEHASKRLTMVNKLWTRPPQSYPLIPLAQPGEAAPAAASPRAAPAVSPARRECPHCGKSVPQAHARFCPHCGKGLAMTRKPEPGPEAVADSRYRAAEQAAAKGQWAEARAFFQSALLAVPGFRDAAQRAADCELQLRCVTLFDEAQRHYQNSEYTLALSTLGRLRGLNAQWPGLADLQTVSECGQQYLQALNQLKAGHRDRAVDLLRLVVSKRPHFRDAAQRLQELEEA